MVVQRGKRGSRAHSFLAGKRRDQGSHYFDVKLERVERQRGLRCISGNYEPANDFGIQHRNLLHSFDRFERRRNLLLDGR